MIVLALVEKPGGAVLLRRLRPRGDQVRDHLVPRAVGGDRRFQVLKPAVRSPARLRLLPLALHQHDVKHFREVARVVAARQQLVHQLRPLVRILVCDKRFELLPRRDAPRNVEVDAAARTSHRHTLRAVTCCSCHVAWINWSIASDALIPAGDCHFTCVAISINVGALAFQSIFPVTGGWSAGVLGSFVIHSRIERDFVNR